MSTTLSHSSYAATRPAMLSRAAVFLQRHRLTQAIADGTSPHSSPQIELRARQLASAHNRSALAGCLERVVDAAEEPARRYSSSVPLMRRAILDSRRAIEDLATDLRGPGEELNVRGVALAEHLLTDGRSPLYSVSEETLNRAVRRAHSALLLA